MRKVKVYIATSLDGYIAHSDGDLDWIIPSVNPNETDLSYLELMESVDTLIMGNNTYQELITRDVDWKYKNKSTYVLTRYKTNLSPKESVVYLTDNIIPTIRGIKQQDGKDIWLVGGGEVISLLLNHDLVDEIQILYIPVILGKGIPLFPNQTKESKWELTGSKTSNLSILMVNYCKRIMF